MAPFPSHRAVCRRVAFALVSAPTSVACPGLTGDISEGPSSRGTLGGPRPSLLGSSHLPENCHWLGVPVGTSLLVLLFYRQMWVLLPLDRAVPLSPCPWCSTGTIVHSFSSSAEPHVPGLKPWRSGDPELWAWCLGSCGEAETSDEILCLGAGLSALCRCVAIR